MTAHRSLPSVLIPLLIAIAACSGASGPPPAERHANAIAAVDESGIHAALVEDGVELLVPVERLHRGGTLMGRLRIDLVDVSQGAPTTVASGSVDVTQTEPNEQHRIRLVGLGGELERSATAPLIIDWTLDLSQDDLYGHRSLFAALGSLEVQLRGPSELPGTGTGPLRVVVRDPNTQIVIDGAVVTGVLSTDDGDIELFSGRTDAHGELLEEIALPEGVAAGSLRVTVAHEDAQVWTDRSVTRRADGQAYLGTDKTIYKPGQDIHLRFLALEGPDHSPSADREVVFEAKDGKGNKVYRRRARTDAFGVAAAIVPTDRRVNEGDWALSAEIDGRRTSIQVPVQRYNLPKIRVDVAPERDWAVPGDTVRGHLHAAYLFGEPVIDGAVTIEARTATGRLLETLTGRTDREGAFDFDLAIPGDIASEALEESGDTVLLSAQVVDAADQLERGEGALALAAAPLRINMVTDVLTPGIVSPVWVVVTDPLGRPVRATIDAPRIDEASQETNASGIAELRFVPPSTATDVRVTATDGAGRSHARQFQLTPPDDDARLRISTDKAIYEPGDRAIVHVSASDGVQRAYLDAYRGATGVLSTAVDLVDGQADVELPITADLGGVLVVDALALTGAGETRRSSRPILVESDDGLQITIASDRESYRPGEEARLDVQVQDPRGAPQVASVGLTVVDEAVFALGGEPTTSIRRSFGLDARVLPPSLRVAGRGADDVMALPDPAEREQRAELLFAGAGAVAAQDVDYNSLAEELPRVVSSLITKLQFDAREHLEALQPGVSLGWFTVDNAGRMLRAARWIDPFGRPYRLAVEGTDQWSLTLVIASDGPDERADTADDVSARTSMSFLFYGDDLWERGGDGEWAAGAGADGDGDADEPAPQDEAGLDDDGQAGGAVRTDFRETAYVNPTLITDGSGRASVTVPLAHSITTWRVSADGSTTGGRIGSARHDMRTFQDFFVDFTLPTKLTRGDEIEVPAVVYNYLSEATSVTVSVEPGDWFELQSSASQAVDLGPSEVRAVRFRLRVTGVGQKALTIRAAAGSLSDGIVRTVDVDPDGQPEDESVSGQLGAEGQSLLLAIPGDTVEGGSSMELVITPGFASEAVQGVDALLQEPTGCFEQTTSSAWPNTLVAMYLEQTGQMTDDRREEVVALVTRGYQRLLTFESPTGGFNWWGDSDPGNRILSAIMLWHLQDLGSLIEIDESVRDRTLAWLTEQQNADGSFEAGDALHAGNEVLGTSKERTTAFIAWALAHTGWADAAVDHAGDWLSTHAPDESDLYANALSANALALIDPQGAAAAELFARLDRAKVEPAEGGVLWPTETPSWTGAGGDTAAIETTGLVAYGLIQADAYPDDAAGAMRFILANKDAVGTWYNTQATMNALRALSAAASPQGSDAVGLVRMTVNGTVAWEIPVDEDSGDLYRRFDVTDLARTGDNDIQLELIGTGELSYRVTRRAYRPVLPGPERPLSMTLAYDTTETTVGSPVTATVQARNDDAGTRDQVIVQVGRAPGFDPVQEDLDALVAQGLVSRAEVRESDVTFYLMALESGETRTLTFRLTPGLSLTASAPASTIYAYYEPSLQHTVDATEFVVQ